MGRTHGEGTVTAPIGLGAFAGSKLQHQEGGFAHWPHHPDKGLENAVTAGITLGLELLEYLLSRVRVAFQQRHDLTFEGIELADSPGTLTLTVAGSLDPFGDGFGIQF